MLILAAAKPSLIDINFGLMFWTIVSFLIVLVVLKKFAFGPIQATLDERRNAIAADIDAAEHAREEAQSALAEYRQALADSRREATKIIEEARRAAEQQRTRDIADLEAEKNRLLKRAKDEIDSETRSSLQAIRDQLADLTVATAEKVVRRQLDETEQRRLIDEAMADVDFSQFAPAESGTASGGRRVVAELIDHGGRVYAEALFRAAEEAGRVPAVDADLRDFVESLASDRAALGSLLNPRLPHESKRRIVAALLKDADPLVRNAMLVLVDNGRLELLHDVSVAYAELAAEQERILDIEVTTAVELGAAQVQQLQQSIEQATGLSARLEAKIDPAIIGGIVLRARGVLLDASVQRELEEIHRALITTPLPVGSEA